MHGREGEEKKRKRHMWPGPGLGTPVAEYSADSFCKDGRKISIGDCALFQGGNAQPFIGLIRSVSSDKEDNCLKLGVNWLYRPTDIELGKGCFLEAAPNEVFYSFHKDEIPAASLLHPCKVAFLRKGVELPSGVSSFVCWRVYDIANKCLWWLTDQDYINERQEEVDQLLEKARVEMHAAVQSGGRSPKPLNGSKSMQQVNQGSDSVQNSSMLFPSQSSKSRKREKGDTGLEPIKRERSSKLDDGDTGHCRLDSSMVKAELLKITDKEGLTNIEGVEKLVHLMQLDRAERRIDLTGRIILANVVSATERYDCLSHFVQLRGVIVLDDWLQEAHKGKIGDGCTPKEHDKCIEEFLLALLRALDKLPVNLHALQACNIGKSVNHLRSHKNAEIQRKARCLVDTWKKRVEAEMNMNDAKSGPNQTISWHGKSGFSEISPGGNRRSGSSDIKCMVTQPTTSRTCPVKVAHGESFVKSVPASPGLMKLNSTISSATVNSRSPPDLPLATIKEEKSSSSSQSQNNSQSCSGDHMKTNGSDARSSTTLSINATRSSAGLSRGRKSSNGFMLSGASGIHTGKTAPVSKNVHPDKIIHPGLNNERVFEMHGTEHGNSHRLIVRLPNPGRSPAQSAIASSVDDPSLVGSRGPSPGISERHELHDRKSKGKGDTVQVSSITDVNNESWQSNDVKDGYGGASDGDDKSPATQVDEGRTSAEDLGKTVEVVKDTSVPGAGGDNMEFSEANPGKVYEPPLASMKALIESCARHSEVDNTHMLVGDDDDVGMNLLASVAAGEMSKSDVVSSGDSPRSSPLMEDAYTGSSNTSKLPSLNNNFTAGGHTGAGACSDSNYEYHESNATCVKIKDDQHQTCFHMVSVNNAVEDSRNNPALSEHNNVLEQSKQTCTSRMDSKTCEKPTDDGQNTRSVVMGFQASSPESKENDLEAGSEQVHHKTKEKSDLFDENKMVEHAGGWTADYNVSGAATDRMNELQNNKCILGEAAVSSHRNEDEAERMYLSSVSVGLGSQPGGEGLTLQPLPWVSMEASENCDHLSGEEKLVETSNTVKADQMETVKDEGSQEEAITDLEVSGARDDTAEENAAETNSSVQYNDEPCIRPGLEADWVECVSIPEVSSAAGSDATTTKLDFDLNEGFPYEHENGEGDHAALVCLASPRTFPVSPVCSNGFPASITIAAAAKGPFVPPEQLPGSKVELGWKGSAATSAFRPAEPRKLLDPQLSASDGTPSDHSAAKVGRGVLDIDLNVADERVIEDAGSRSLLPEGGTRSILGKSPILEKVIGGLDLDLNRVDEGAESGPLPPSRRLDSSFLISRPLSSCGLSNDETILRDFDLNNGPSLDELSAHGEAGMRIHLYPKTTLPLGPPIMGMRVNNGDPGSLSSWFPPGNSYQAVAIPSFFSDRVEHSYPLTANPRSHQRGTGSANGGALGDAFRNPVPHHSMPFAPVAASGAAFPYAGFPFGTSFPLASTSFSGASTYMDSLQGTSCFSAIPSQPLGQAGGMSSHYPRPYVVSVPEAPASSGSDSRKWVRSGLDLNSGPGSAADAEGRDERPPPPMIRQLSIMEEQGRMYQATKRKEPDGGWDATRLNYKQPSWS